MMRAIDGLREVSAALKGYGIEDSHKEAEIIFTQCMEIEKVALYRDNPPLSLSQTEEIKKILERRGKREPLQYIIGNVDFYGLKIKVGPGVLIPRPETELIVEEAIKAVASHELRVISKNKRQDSELRTPNSEQNSSLVTRHSSLRILDLCTGSGCLALALAREFPEAEVFGVDVSEKALEYALMNAGINDIRNITLMKGDLYDPVKGRKFDIIVSNPPYIRKEDICTLQPEIRGWEPLDALDGGEDGLHFYRNIFSAARDYLCSGGIILIEVGRGEADDAAGIAEDCGLRCLSVIRDYSGIKRVLIFKP